MRTLLDIKDANILQAGIFPSLPPNQPALWKDGENVIFYDGAAEKAKGMTPLGSTNDTVTALSQAYVDGEQRAYIGTPTSWHKLSKTGQLQIGGGFTGGTWSMTPWGNWLLATNGKDPVQVSKNTDSMAPLAGVPVSKARIIRKLANRPMIFYGQTAAWPSATDIENWTPGPETRAGNMFIRDLDSDIIAVEPLGEQLAFYTENKMGFASFIGGTSVYGFKVRLEGIGALGINAIISVGARHYGLSRDGIWMTDASGFDYIDQPAVNRFLDANLDASRGDEITGVHNKDKSMVQWFFWGLDGVRRGLGYNYRANSWHRLNMNVTAAMPQEVFDKPIVGIGNQWGLYDNGTDLGATAMPTSLVTGALDAGAPNNYKWWDMVQLRWQGSANLECRFGLHKQETFGQDPDDEWLPWQPLQRENWIQRESVFLTMELRSTLAGVDYRISGLAVHGDIAGLVQ